jgi:hypothetical protein
VFVALRELEKPATTAKKSILGNTMTVGQDRNELIGQSTLMFNLGSRPLYGYDHAPKIFPQ